jgi:putative spermidine/putrescine transport system permease protein
VKSDEQSLSPWLVGLNLLVYAFLLAPLVVIGLVSFTTTQYVTFPPVGFTLRWYAQILNNQEFLGSLTLSLGVAATTAVLATILGVPVALAIDRYLTRGRALVEGFFLSPLLLPALVIGVAMLQFYARMRWSASFQTLVIGHLVITMPYVIRLVMANLAGLDPLLERAAQNLGADPWVTFRRVVMPQAFPGIMAGMAFAFIVSFDDLSVALFVSGPFVVTLPIRIFNYIEYSLDPFVTAVSMTVMLFTAVVVVIIERFFGVGRLLGAGESAGKSVSLSG